MQATQSTSEVRSAILLAAGRGSRLSPYTDTTPKPLLPYKGKPTLELILDALIAAGISKLIVVTHYLENQIEDFVAQYLEQHKGADQLKIKTVSQQQLTGTANAVSEAIQSQPGWFNESFIVTATDYLTEADFYTDLSHFHATHDSKISISVKRLPAESQTMRSSVRITEGMTITEVVEKPEPGTEPSPFTANLIYILPASIVEYLAMIEPTIRGELELQSAINLWLKNNGTAQGLLQATPLEWQPEMNSG